MLKELQVSTIQDDCGSSFKVRLREREREREREKAGMKDGKDWKERCLG